MESHVFYENNQDFSNFKSDIKPIALYFPQYHEIPENNEWWGKGFTEWTNVRKAQPRFDGHNQPRIPSKDFGYYDLTDVNTLKKQAELARSHGIYAFGVYYYWFSGKRLMEKPIDILLEHPEIDFPFFMIWANENWTRRWDGNDDYVLISQNYTDDDSIRFIQDLKKYIDDPRYMRIDGKPVIGIYKPNDVPHIVDVLSTWRTTAEKSGIGDILIWSCITEHNTEMSGISSIVDAEYEFPPRCNGYISCSAISQNGKLYDYCELVESLKKYCADSEHPVYRGTMLAWDNSARRQTNYHIWNGYSPETFYYWNRIIISYTRTYFHAEQRFIFVNAWNEWGEGTYLEPDHKDGYAGINALSKAIFDLPYNENTHMTTNNGFYKHNGWDKELSSEVKIAVQIHVFYIDLIPDIFSKLINIQKPFDIYVTTNSEYKADCFKRMFADNRILHHNVRYVYVDIYENKGRDVVPFLKQMAPVYHKYKYICHIHTKKSKHNDFGNLWREYLYDNLLGNQAIVDDILYMLESDPSVGIVYPKTLHKLEPFMVWGSNKECCLKLAETIGIKLNIQQKISNDKLIFPAGNMFWIRTSAVSQLLEYQINENDIPPENGQIDGTIMHAIERLWCYTAYHNGFKAIQIENPFENVTRKYNLETELNSINYSIKWCLMNICKRMINVVMPRGSAIRNLVKKAFEFILRKRN